MANNANPIASVFEISQQIMDKAEHVYISEAHLVSLADKLSKTNIEQELGNIKGIPGCFSLSPDGAWKSLLYSNVAFYELFAASVNYCYWYGRHDIRPNGSSSVKMYEILDDIFRDSEMSTNLDYISKRFQTELIACRFPLLNKRREHIEEIRCRGFEFISYLISTIESNKEWENTPNYMAYWMTELIKTCPGFSEDMFLKRASLFFIMLNRRLGWFDQSIHLLPVPADYQVPKMLRYFGVLTYNRELDLKISKHQLISSGSQEECEIRAATVLTCRRLSELSGVRMCDIDTFLWSKRKESTDPFHLTITTDY